jgi:hypothetical protein
MKFKLSITLFIVCGVFNAFAQADSGNDHDHGHHSHHHNEIAIANSVVYLLTEKDIAYGLHIHYTRILIGSLGLGVGYEKIFDDHKHNTIGVIVNYRIKDNLSFAVSPGIAFSKDERKGKLALHLESAYEFQIKNFHLGPSVEYSFDSDEQHLSIGLHLGYGF